MDIAQDFVVSAVLKGPAQCAGILEVLEADCPVSSESEVEEQEVLSDDWSCRATEVEGERVFDRAEIMEFENEILWEETLRTPDNPTDANLSKAELVCNTILSIHLAQLNDRKPTPGGINGDNPGNLEIPYELGSYKRGNKTTRGRVDMYPGWNGKSYH